MDNRYLVILWMVMLTSMACKDEIVNPESTPNPMNSNVEMNSDNSKVASILQQLLTNYEPLPEKAISISSDSTVFAQYALPTTRYRHGILGDDIEAGQLVVVMEDTFYEFILAEDYVYEDIRPRLYDVDADGQLEFITIRSHVSLGGGIAIYKIANNRLEEYAQVPEIGRSNRWLNIVEINDVDNDGIVELIWIETPHIGGTLKVANIQAGTLEVLSTAAQYSNHAIGDRNLCLSVLTEQNGHKTFYVPTQRRDKIIGFRLNNNQLRIVDEITQTIDFSQTLLSQYEFDGVLLEENNCINP